MCPNQGWKVWKNGLDPFVYCESSVLTRVLVKMENARCFRSFVDLFRSLTLFLIVITQDERNQVLTSKVWVQQVRYTNLKWLEYVFKVWNKQVGDMFGPNKIAMRAVLM